MKKQHDFFRRFAAALVALLLLLTAACASQTAEYREASSNKSEPEPVVSESSMPELAEESQVEPETPASQAEESTQPAATSTAAVILPAQVVEPSPGAPTPAGLEELHSLNVTGRTYQKVKKTEDQAALCEMLDALLVEELATADTKQPPIAGFLMVRNGIKTSYTVTDTQVYSTGGSTKVYQSDMKLRESLQALADGYNNSYAKSVPQWLAYMSTGRITKAQFGGKSEDFSKDASFVTTDARELQQISHLLKNLGVNPAKTDTETLLNPTTSGDGISLRLTFDSGVEYLLYGFRSGAEIVLSSSDMGYDIMYTLSPPEQLAKLVALAEDFSGCTPTRENPLTAKPVIYLYPEEPTEVLVQLDFAGELTYTYPVYNKGWRVTAYPDGRLVNKPDNTEHFYLFWEGNSGTDWRFDEGFCVAGDETEVFLREKLAYMGLTPREYNDFLVYWVPEMQQNPYNLITFATRQYEQLAPLMVSPAPDSVLRVHMVYKAVDAPVAIPAQQLNSFVRKGFTMVEWGGSRAGVQLPAGKPNLP